MSRAHVTGKTAMPGHSAVSTEGTAPTPKRAVSAGRGMSSAVLCGKRYGDYQKQERRNVNWTPHSLIICPMARGGSCNFGDCLSLVGAPKDDYRFRTLGFFGDAFFAECFAAGLGRCFTGGCATFGGFAGLDGFALDSGLA